ncbi:MAG: glycosyltransferase, partial [Muribaculaceae bacterium]|nr:glycosyltransferase [Muribaculaceae bacterium]
FYIIPRRKRAELGLPEGKKLIVMGAARLDDPVKGLDLAIEALNRLADSGRTDAHAVFFGAIRDPHALDGLRLPHTALGPVADKDFLHELYAHATAVLSSSLYETLPGTLIEGQAAGCFPVSFGEGGQADIIDHGTSGYIARYRDTDDLARGLETALDGRFDPELLRRHVEERFSSQAVARQYLRLLNI